MDYRPPGSDWFSQNDLTPPETVAHGNADNIRENLRPAKVTSWRLEGNKLIAQTDLGELVQTIPTDYILEGTTSEGLPKFRKVVY